MLEEGEGVGDRRRPNRSSLQALSHSRAQTDLRPQTPQASRDAHVLVHVHGQADVDLSLNAYVAVTVAELRDVHVVREDGANEGEVGGVDVSVSVAAIVEGNVDVTRSRSYSRTRSRD